MIRIIILMLTLLVMSSAIGQQVTKVELPIDKETSLITFSDVVPSEKNSKAKLYRLLRTWATTTTDIFQKQLTVSDSATGDIIIDAKNLIEVKGGNMCYVKYSIILFVKDFKFKYIMRNLSHVGCTRDGFGKMDSYGELEKLIIVQHDRDYFDNILQGSKNQMKKVTDSMIKYITNGKDEKDF